jgi:hypothetical protein
VTSPRVLGNDDLETAKRNLLNLASFGLFEDTDRATFAISDRLGLPHRTLTRRLNVTPERERDGADGFDADDLAALREANTLDTQLYDFAREVFEERFAILRSRYGEATGPFDADRLASRMRGAFLIGDRLMPRLTSATVDPSAGVVLSGWYDRFFYAPVSPGSDGRDPSARAACFCRSAGKPIVASKSRLFIRCRKAFATRYRSRSMIASFPRRGRTKTSRTIGGTWRLRSSFRPCPALLSVNIPRSAFARLRSFKQRPPVAPVRLEVSPSDACSFRNLEPRGIHLGLTICGVDRRFPAT